MLRNVNRQKLTNVKVSPNSLTSRAQDPPTFHPTLTQLSLLKFRKKFVPLPTLKWAIFAPLLHLPIYCFTNYSFIMGKVTSLYGKTTGKIGSIVFSTSGGETIAREYNPHVANPNTQAQVNQRARMKLMSQLSAALSPVIAMQKEGLVSRRNKFVQKNFDACYALNGEAQITYENVQLTEGNTALPAFTAGGGVVNDKFVLDMLYNVEPSAAISRIVYCVFRKTSEGKLEFVTSVINSKRNDVVVGQYFYTQLTDLPIAEYVIFAYGMCDTSERATAQYGNMNVVTASDLARLIASRAISYQDYQFTQTRAVTIASDGNPVAPETPGNVRVFVTALGQGGTVTGGGSYAPGTSVTVVATPASGYDFVKWIYNGTELTASTSASYTFVVNQQTDLVAVFESNQGGGGL